MSIYIIIRIYMSICTQRHVYTEVAERLDKTQTRKVMVQSNLGPETKQGGRVGQSGSLIHRVRISGDNGAQGSGQFSYSIRVSGDDRV